MKTKRTSKKQKAYNYMKEKIVKGFYAPGQRIVINQLARELSTSAIPIREAVRQLEAEGLVEYKQNIGPVVRKINENEYVEALTVLAVMEGYATALAHGTFTEDAITKLYELNEQMKEALMEFNFGIFGKLNREFHFLIYSHCPNQYLVDAIKRTWDKLDAIRVAGSTINPKRAKESIAEHEEIIQLLEKDADFHKIEQVARSHKLNMVDAFLKGQNQVTGTTFI